LLQTQRGEKKKREGGKVPPCFHGEKKRKKVMVVLHNQKKRKGGKASFKKGTGFLERGGDICLATAKGKVPDIVRGGE